MYYGADLDQFPPEVRSWVVNQAFTKEKMEKVWMKEPRLKAWWSDDGNSVLFEASYTIADGLQGAGKRITWGHNTHYKRQNSDKQGIYAKYNSLKFNYKSKRESERLVKNDPAYADVVDFAKRLSADIEYDWAEYDDYKGAAPVKTPGKKYADCSGYTDEVMEKVLALKSVDSVEKWVSDDHSWNVLNLVDGRKLYFDLTWFDNEKIDHETGLISALGDYGWENITYDEEVFKYATSSYAGYLSHANGSLQEILKK